MKTCQICGLPIATREDEENCERLHRLEANEIIKQDYREFVLEEKENKDWLSQLNIGESSYVKNPTSPL